MTERILLIVDPQNDFIDGSLAVLEAEMKMKALAEYLKEVPYYDYVCITMDSHPKNHCSFKENGGTWPEHCIIYTSGWDYPEYLKDALDSQAKNKTIITHYHKGTNSEREEYSIFDNCEDGYTLDRQISTMIDEGRVYIDICGIAGDYCVLETLKGLRKIIGDRYIRVLTQYIASIDGGEKLMNYIKENNLNYE